MASTTTAQPTANTFAPSEKDITVIPQTWTRDLSNKFQAQQMKRPSITVTVQPRPKSHFSDSASSTDEASTSCASSVHAAPVVSEPQVARSQSQSQAAPQPSRNAFQPRQVSRRSYITGLMNGMAAKHATPQTNGYADIDARPLMSSKAVSVAPVSAAPKSKSTKSRSKAVGTFVKKSLMYSAASLTPGGVGVPQRW